jgi:hypothetical protein
VNGHFRFALTGPTIQIRHTELTQKILTSVQLLVFEQETPIHAHHTNHSTNQHEIFCHECQFVLIRVNSWIVPFGCGKARCATSVFSVSEWGGIMSSGREYVFIAKLPIDSQKQIGNRQSAIGNALCLTG